MSYAPMNVHTMNPVESTEATTQMPDFRGLSDEEIAEIAAKVLVAVPYRAGEGVGAGICGHFANWGRFALDHALIKDPHGGFIEVVRAGIVREFLHFCESHPKTNFLVMIDNDEAIDWDAPMRLARWNLPVVSGVVCSYSDKRGIFACFTVRDENGAERFPSLLHTKVMPSSGLIEAAQVGTGLICIRKDVLQTLVENNEYPFYIPEDIRKVGAKNGTLKKSEDIVFSEQCEQYGFKRYVDLSVRAVHFKTLPLSWPADGIRDDIDPLDWKVSIFDRRS